MKISTKLILLNFVVLAIFATEGIVIFSSVAKVKESTDEVTGNVVPTLATIPDIGAAFAEARRQILLWGAVPPSEEHSVAKGVAAARANLVKKLDEYNKAIDLDSPSIKDQDRKLFQDLAKNEQAWEGMVDQLLTIEANDQQIKYIREVTSPQADKVFSSINALTQFNVDLGAKKSEEASAGIHQLYIMIVVISSIGALTVLVIGLLISRGITKALKTLQTQTAEVGASLDFTRRFAAGGKDEISETANVLNNLLSLMQQSLSEVSAISQGVGSHAAELATNTSELSAANEMVSHSTAAMAAAVEQVTVSIAHVAERSQETRDLAEKAGEMAAIGSTTVEDTISKVDLIASRANTTARQVEALSQKVVDISAVVTTIKGIAEQTNLLALNAAIEAARAGDVGRGFAVVADEVRKLAERTSVSTYEIAQTIEQIQEEARQTVAAIHLTVDEVVVGVERVTSVGEVVAGIRSSAQTVLGSVNDISYAMSEQSVASNSMAREIEKVAQMTEQTSANAMGVAEVGTKLHADSQTLLQIVARYKV
ncbi:methyl-accepting chemotaxis protein [Silvimonas terrae]|uniref:Methyl-accepting chemotaxis protein n=1 Tax=Silvimonas terrae TaxID=300266 RepID=A0A840RAI0_9NEIS|nr:methyl-accepting chemotaxis protein [Silvimonas terrae]MBB5189423.1 methyl-accepting chemotaxis protein [Silvimonas terrae]